jgi:hypothetical protein
MHVRSSGDLVEITSERDILAISCDLITHAVDMLMSMCKLHNSNSIVRIPIAEIVQRRQAVWTQRIGICIFRFVYDSVRRMYCTERSWIKFLYEIVS